MFFLGFGMLIASQYDARPLDRSRQPPREFSRVDSGSSGSSRVTQSSVTSYSTAATGHSSSLDLVPINTDVQPILEIPSDNGLPADPFQPVLGDESVGHQLGFALPLELPIELALPPINEADEPPSTGSISMRAPTRVNEARWNPSS
jgi:hypothetical protein